MREQVTTLTVRWSLGRHTFGLSILACGLVTLTWHDFKDWVALHSILNATSGTIVIYGLAAAQCFGGIAVQFRRTAKAGAIAIGAVYLLFSLLSVPQIITTPQVYASWGNFFYPFCLVVGALLVYGSSALTWEPKTLIRIGSILLGVCAASFGIEQAEFLARTASLVPKWIPPSQMFWAIITCIPFGLAAIALIIDGMALLAARLLTLMMMLFGVLVWIPILLVAPHSHGNWDEATQTFAIAAVAWILADLLGERSRITKN